jgi:hypothetical protein
MNDNAANLCDALRDVEWKDQTPVTSNNESKFSIPGQNFPQPSNPSTKIDYRLNKPSRVRLSVYDITGREVNRLVDQHQDIGEYCVEWKGNSNYGGQLASGMYFAKLSVDNESISRKIVLTK